jgi:hypothetical protein
MKKLLFLLGCLLVLGNLPAWAQAETDIVVVRIDIGLRRMILTRGEGQSEVMPFNVRFGVDKGAVDINEAYYRLVKKLGQEGYVMQQRLDGGDSSSTLLFVKAPKP